MASDKKNNFILYKDFKSTIDLLTDEQAGKLIKAVFSYVNGRVEPNFTDGAITIAFSILKTQLERDLVKYKTIVERNQTNGLKGGRPKNNPNENDKPKKPSGLLSNPNEPKKADSDSVSDSVSDNDSDIIKKNSNKKVFVPPTLDEVKNYCTERNNNVNAEKWMNFYESKGWMVGKNKMKDWKAAVRTWEDKKEEEPQVYRPKGLSIL